MAKTFPAHAGALPAPMPPPTRRIVLLCHELMALYSLADVAGRAALLIDAGHLLVGAHVARGTARLARHPAHRTTLAVRVGGIILLPHRTHLTGAVAARVPGRAGLARALACVRFAPRGAGLARETVRFAVLQRAARDARRWDAVVGLTAGLARRAPGLAKQAAGI